ncbi:MAG: hypothetical protein LBQ91_05500 [Oscillospiraceae bacterium]|jgi:hypothetical protein|nr:hypothetical protein [Oscillospiraceae bacterium]
MTSKIRVRIVTAAIVIIALALGFGAGSLIAASSDPGSSGDPLVSKDYLDNTFRPQLEAAWDAAIAAREAQLEANLQAKIYEALGA